MTAIKKEELNVFLEELENKISKMIAILGHLSLHLSFSPAQIAFQEAFKRIRQEMKMVAPDVRPEVMEKIYKVFEREKEHNE